MPDSLEMAARAGWQACRQAGSVPSGKGDGKQGDPKGDENGETKRPALARPAGEGRQRN